MLRHGPFLWIWLGSMTSNVGNWMETVAQAWLVQRQTQSPFEQITSNYIDSTFCQQASKHQSHRTLTNHEHAIAFQWVQAIDRL